MSESNAKIIKAITHYQQNLERYFSKNETEKMLHCIGRLRGLPITVSHLEETGVGRTVNSMRKMDGSVGEAAKSLVNKWKGMVENDNSDHENDARKDSDNTKSKHKNSSSHNSREKSHEDRDRKHAERDRLKRKEEERSRKDEEKIRKEEERKRKDEERRAEKERVEKERKKEEERIRKDLEEEYRERERLLKEEEDNRKEEEKIRKEQENIRKEEERIRKEVEREKIKRDEERRKRHDDREKKSSRDEEKKQNGKKKSKKSKRSDDDGADSSEENRKRHKRNEDEEECSTSSNHKKKKSHDKHSKSSKHKSESNKKHKSSSSDKHKRKTSISESEDDAAAMDSSDSIDSRLKHNDDSDNESKSKKSDSKSKSKTKAESPKKKSGSKKKVSLDDGIDCGSGASFAEALGMIMPVSRTTKKLEPPFVSIMSPIKPVKSKQEIPPKVPLIDVPLLSMPPSKLEPLDVNISSLLPSISTNYKPLGNLPLDVPSLRNKQQMVWNDEDLTKLMYSKNQRTKVYSGNKVGNATVVSLFELCIRVLQDNIDALEFTGGVPYDLLKPVLEKATPDQLFMLEHHNPYIIEESEELWNHHCIKEFRNKKREELETSREMYMRCLDERERKLKALTANIKLSQDKSLPVRQTKLAYVDSAVKPPRNILKKQVKNGIDRRPAVTPSSRLNALAQVPGAVAISVPSGRASSSSSSGSSAAFKVKKAPLMAKTLQFMKGRFGRR